MIELNIRVTDRTPVKVLKREITKAKKATMRDTAQRFLDRHIAPHFGPANRRRFNHKRRRPVYAKEIKPREGRGQGKHVDNVLKGETRRRALSMAKITATSNGSKLRLRVPTYFHRPFVGSFVGKDGKRKRITQQPDKVKELKTIDARDRRALRKFAQRRFLKYLKQAHHTRTETLSS